MYLKFLDQVWLFLDGKKTYISALTLLVIPFIVGQGLITKEWGEFLMAIIAILVGGGKFITDKAVANGTELGNAVIAKRK